MKRAPIAVVVVVVGAGAFAAACGAHEDVTPMIAVQPGAAARAMAILGHGGPNDPTPRRSEPDAGASAPEEPPGTIALSCMEERGAIKALARVPCEIEVAARGAADAPDDFVSTNGKVAIAVAPGAYHVVVSRGPEYARAELDIDVRAGKTAWAPGEGAVLLRRVVDTRGYLAAELDDVGAGDDARAAVFDDAAAGIEVVVGDVTSTVPIVQAAKLEDALVPVAPFEVDAVDALADEPGLLRRLATKRPPMAVASQPSARTYVRVEDGALPSTWSPAREADFVRGVRDRRDVVLTTGPFLRVTTNGAPIGGVARVAGDKTVEVKVHVECAPWLAVDHVTIARAVGAPVPPQAVTLHALPSGARAADVSFHFEAPADDAFVVRADASPGAPGDLAPAAVTGAIWIDADGDGESLGRTAPTDPRPGKP